MELGWSDKRFWSATPAEYIASIDQWQRKQRRKDYRTGIIASTLVNVNSKESAEPSHPFDFFPEHQSETESYQQRKEKRQKGAQVLNAAKIRAMDKARTKKKKGAEK